MNNLLLILVILVGRQVNEHCYDTPKIRSDREVKKYAQEAISITPARGWVNSVDGMSSYYGYYSGNQFNYCRVQPNGLSNLSSTYSRYTKEPNLKSVPAVRESYNEYFSKVTTKSKPAPQAKFRKGHNVGKGFSWIEKPGHHKKTDWDWNKK